MVINEKHGMKSSICSKSVLWDTFSGTRICQILSNPRSQGDHYQSIHVPCVMVYYSVCSFLKGWFNLMNSFALFCSNEILKCKELERHWKCFVQSAVYFKFFPCNDPNVDLWPWPPTNNRSCDLISYQGQGQRSMFRSLHSKIVKSFPDRTKGFSFL